MNRLPLVIILGATGTGKTKLSLEIAKRFHGEIISADSMQVYKALNIITAKATEDEQREAPHHLLNIIKPSETFTVVDFRNKALPIVERLLESNKVPIIVGGTNYYIESLLWKILIEDVGNNPLFKPGIGAQNEHELPAPELHKMLQKLDPDMARLLHPNNKRKILRSLEILQQKGKKHSDILKEQRTSEGGCSLGGGLRYKNALVFWLQCEQEVLDNRLNSRVDNMITDGLITELSDFHKLYNEDRIKTDETPDYTKGIFQSIGFKEFHEYLMLEENDKKGNIGEKIFAKGVEDLKMVTRRYAKKQNRWVQNRFLGESDREVPAVYGLSTTDVTSWHDHVTTPAFDVIDCYLASREITRVKLPVVKSKARPLALDDSYKCDVCERVFIGIFQYKMHQNSNKHKKMVARKKKLQVNQIQETEEVATII